MAELVNEDVYSTEEWKDFTRRVRRDMIPKLEGSSIAVSIVPDGAGDVKFAVELGFSIMLDKPIIAVVAPGTPIPAKLRLVADAVVEVDLRSGSEEELEKLGRAVREIVQRMEQN